MEGDETPEACLKRELLEELSIDAEVGAEVFKTEHRYAEGFHVRLHFFRVQSYRGTPANCAFERIEWVVPSDLSRYDFLEADREVVRRMMRGEIAGVGQ